MNLIFLKIREYNPDIIWLKTGDPDFHYRVKTMICPITVKDIATRYRMLQNRIIKFDKALKQQKYDLTDKLQDKYQNWLMESKEIEKFTGCDSVEKIKEMEPVVVVNRTSKEPYMNGYRVPPQLIIIPYEEFKKNFYYMD